MEDDGGFSFVKTGDGEGKDGKNCSTSSFLLNAGSKGCVQRSNLGWEWASNRELFPLSSPGCGDFRLCQYYFKKRPFQYFADYELLVFPVMCTSRSFQKSYPCRKCDRDPPDKPIENKKAKTSFAELPRLTFREFIHEPANFDFDLRACRMKGRCCCFCTILSFERDNSSANSNTI